MKTNAKPGKTTGKTTQKPAEPPAKKGPDAKPVQPKKKTPLTQEDIKRIEKADQRKPSEKRDPERINRQKKSVKKN